MCTKEACGECGRPTWRGCGGHISSCLQEVPISERCPHQARTDAERWHLYLQQEQQGTQNEIEMMNLENLWNAMPPQHRHVDNLNPSRLFNPSRHPKANVLPVVQPVQVEPVNMPRWENLVSGQGSKPKPSRNMISHGNHKNLTHHGRSSSRRSSHHYPNMPVTPVENGQSDVMSKGFISQLSQFSKYLF